MSDAAKINDLLSRDKLSIDLAKKIIAEQQNQIATLARQVREQQAVIDELRELIDPFHGKHLS